MACAPPAAVRLGLSTHTSAALCPQKANMLVSQGASGKEKRWLWLVFAAAKPPLPPPAPRGPTGAALGWGPGRPDSLQTLGLRHMGHFWTRNLSQAVCMGYTPPLLPASVAGSGGGTTGLQARVIPAPA